MISYTIGIDVGGTKMNAVLFNGKEVVADYLLATPKDGFDHFSIMLLALIDPLLAKAKADNVRVGGIGLGIAGMLSCNRESMSFSPNILYLNGINLVKKIEEKTSLPVKIDNDANCFIRAEACLGAGRKYSSVFGVVIGTGIGGGWSVDKKIYTSKFGAEGEVGHLIVNYQEKISFEKAYQTIIQGNAHNIAQRAYGGDQIAEKNFQEIGRLLGITLANVANLIFPEAFIIGGSVVGASDLFFPEAKKALQEFILTKEAKKKIKILKSTLGHNAGAVGAALLFD